MPHKKIFNTIKYSHIPCSVLLTSMSLVTINLFNQTMDNDKLTKYSLIFLCCR